MGEGEISVELRLAFTKLQQDLADARKQIATGLNVALPNLVGDTEKGATAMDKLGSRVESTRSKLGALAREWAAVGKAVEGMKITMADGPVAAGGNGAGGGTVQLNGYGLASVPSGGRATLLTAAQAQQHLLYQAAQAGRWHSTMGGVIPPHVQMPQFAPPVMAQPPVIPGTNWAPFLRNIGFGALPIANPTSLLANLASFRQTFTAFNSPAGQSALGAAGLAGGAGGAAMAAGGITLAAAGVGLALKALQHAVSETSEAFGRAAHYYSQVVRGGGMSPGWTISQSNIAGIVGVSTQELQSLGGVFEQLNERTKYFNQTLTDTMPALAATAQNWRVAGLAMSALWAKVAEAFAPVSNEIARTVEAVAQFITAAAGWKYLAFMLKTAFDLILKPLEAIILGIMGLNMALVGLSGVVKYVLKEINNAVVNHLPMVAKVLGMRRDSSDPFGETKSAWDAFNKMGRNLFNPSNAEAAGSVATNAAKMPGSTFERMGLVIGPAGASNHLRDINHHTKRAADYLEKMLSGDRSNPASQGRHGPLVNAPA